MRAVIENVDVITIVDTVILVVLVSKLRKFEILHRRLLLFVYVIIIEDKWLPAFH